MSMRGSPGLVTVVFVVAGALIPPSALAQPLMCQARGSYAVQPPPTDVSFEAFASAGTAPFDFHWDFGDGSSSGEQNPTHTYNETGGYRAILTVTDAAVPQALCSDTVAVLVGIVPDAPCYASASSRWGEAPLAVDFGAQPGLISDPGPYTWTWRFGDGDVSASQSPSHAFEATGTYWAVAAIHSQSGSFDCYPTLRVSAIPSEVAAVGQTVHTSDFRLEPARPNPCGAMTSFGFQLARPGRAQLVVRDLGGRLVATVMDGEQPAGPHVAVWQAGSGGERAAPPGLYFAELRQGSRVASVRFVKLR